MKMNMMSRFEIFKRDKFTCQYCGRRPPQVALELEHVTPLSLGGTHDAWNLLTACFECNRGKLARPLTLEQIHRLDGSVPNLIAQLMAMALDGPDDLNILQRLFDVSAGGRVFGDWVLDLERVFNEIVDESWIQINAQNDSVEREE